MELGQLFLISVCLHSFLQGSFPIVLFHFPQSLSILFSFSYLVFDISAAYEKSYSFYFSLKCNNLSIWFDGGSFPVDLYICII